MLIKHGNNALSSVTAFPSAVPTGQPVLLSTATASASSSIEFTSGIDSTYDIYKFEFINCHPSTNAVGFQFNGSTDGGSNYNVTKTTTSFGTYHSENDAEATLTYNSGTDLAQSTAFQTLTFYQTMSDDIDAHVSGTLTIFNPSSTTYVKHFISRAEAMHQDGGSRYAVDSYIAGYANTTSAIDAIKFQMSSGNIDAGTIKMYGISAWV